MARRSGNELEAALRRGGLQVTAQRMAVLGAVAEAPHATTDEVVRRVRAVLGGVSRQAVYDALAAFTERGLVRRIQPAGSPARYETRTGDNHHHLICRVCQRTVDVDCVVGEAPCLTPRVVEPRRVRGPKAASDTGGFEVHEAEVVFWGRCPECVAAAGAVTAGETNEGNPTTREEAT